MTKMYMKQDCEFKNNRIVCGSEIVAIDRKVFNMLDALEDSLQRAEYILAQDAPQKTPDLEGFERETNKKHPMMVKPMTPITDMKVMAAMSLMEEADKSTVVDRVNDMLKQLQPLAQFVYDEYIVECDNGVTSAFDLVMLGNPLEMKEEQLVDAVVTIVNADLHKEGKPLLRNVSKVADDPDEFIDKLKNEELKEKLKEDMKSCCCRESEDPLVYEKHEEKSCKYEDSCDAYEPDAAEAEAEEE